MVRFVSKDTVINTSGDLSYWDVAAQEWAMPNGTFVFSVGLVRGI